MLSSSPIGSKRGASSTAPSSSSSLRDRLAAVLPQGHKFGIHHISTPPTPTEPLCVAPPGHRPDKTYRESHFLAVSIHPPGGSDTPPKRASPGADRGKEPAPKKQALAFAVEVLIFTTAYQTTLFVSKADSTGSLHLLNLPKGAPSPIRQVCATFLAYLRDHRRRKHVQSVVNLFARAQAQYLFPGSVHNKGKHVLDDRGLVRWWCKVLSPLMEGLSEEPWASTKGYLLVPGLEETEMRAFIPRASASLTNWVIGHPLELISHYTRDFNSVPPRCLIPGYPDDPKSRFRDELDEEVSKQNHNIGAWKSVRSLEQFWEMMAFRQECSSGRLTGFIWLVFDSSEPSSNAPSAGRPETKLTAPKAPSDLSLPPVMPATPPRRQLAISTSDTTPPPRPSKAPAKKPRKKAKKKLLGRIVPRTPKIKTHARSYKANRPTVTAYYYWPREARGDKLVEEAEYKRIVDLLLHLDFSTLDKTVGSSTRWLNEVGMGDGGEWGVVAGKAAIPSSPRVSDTTSNTSGNVTNLTGLIRRKNAPAPSEPGNSQQPDSAAKEPTEPAKVNVLGTNLVRKRKKGAEDS